MRDWLREHGRGLAIALAAGVFLALTGAFGTGMVPLLPRLGYWLVLMMGGSVIGFVVGPYASRRPRLGENRYLLWALITLAVTLPGAVFVWWFTGFVFGGRGLDSLPYFFGSTALISAAVTAIVMLVNTPGAATSAPPADAPAPKVRFMERLPPKLMGAVVHAVEAEDHYLRLHTSKGQDLILMRLADAIAELDGIEGAQVHRSWWVARAAVSGVKRDNGRVSLVLPDGAEAPVSRPNVKALREAGWL